MNTIFRDIKDCEHLPLNIYACIYRNNIYDIDAKFCLYWIDLVVSVEAEKLQIFNFVLFGCDDVEKRWSNHGLGPD